MPFPYESATSGKNAVEDMRKTLQTFGAGLFGVMEAFEAGELLVQFVCRGRRVSVREG